MKKTIILAFTIGIISIIPQVFADSPSFEIETVAENLRVPWAIDFAPDGRIFFTERSGEIRVIENNQVISEPLKELDVGFVEGGLLGIALDPNFEENHYIYVYYTYTDFIFTYNKVVRFTETDNKLTDEFALIEKIPGGPIHDGGRIKFADDGTLYITTGEAGNPGLSQDLNSLGGKILRINSDGSIPEDNPFENSPIYSLGHRNPQGLDWDPVTGSLVISEHGPSGERGFAHDEINVIKKGANYGWPDIIGDETKEGMKTPILHSGTTTWAPSGAVFYDSDKIPEFEGRFLVATLAGNHLLAIGLDLENNQIIDSEEYFVGEYGRLRDVAIDDKGNIYILTSNQDGRGSPAQNDDRILKISPLHHKDHHDTKYESPLKQLESVSDWHDIKCNKGLTLIFKNSIWMPVCVKTDSVEKLIERGWASDHFPEHGMHN